MQADFIAGEVLRKCNFWHIVIIGMYKAEDRVLVYDRKMDAESDSIAELWYNEEKLY